MTRRKDAPPETALSDVRTQEPAAVEPFTVEVETLAPVEPSPEPDPRPSAPPPPSPPRRPGILGPLLGGALAALGGFALSHFNVFGLAVPDSSAALATLTAQLNDTTQQQAGTFDKLGNQIAALENRVATLETAPAPAAPDLSRLDTLDQRLAAIEAMPAEGGASTAALTAKLADLEQRLASLPKGGNDAALQQKLDDALSRLTEAETAATARASEAEAAAASAARAKALDTLTAAVTSGKPYATELQALGDQSLTDALGTSAATGVPTLEALRASFPDAAREALRISHETSAEDGWGTRIVDFLAAQTGARSLTPQEGDTPGAILSRAEFALSEGRVSDALSEVDPLDPTIKAPLEPWIAEAKAHLAAAAALQAARGE
jgi:hypothetical protein